MHPALRRALLVALSASTATAGALAQGAPPREDTLGALPRWREGGTPPDDHGRSLVPFAVRPSAARVAPTSGLIESPPEYTPVEGVLFRYGTTSWPQVVTDCVAALTGDPAHDEIAYVVVSGASTQASATSAFTAAGADLSKVVFIVQSTDSVWLRDYGPHFVWQSGTRVIADSHYYPSRPTDNFIPTRLAQNTFGEPPYAMGLYYSGGNFQPGPNRSGFITSLISQDNPDLTIPQIADLYQAYQGIDTLHVFPRLPSTVDGTGHIDMWMYLVDEDTCVISEFKPGSNATAIQVTNDAVPYMQGLGFAVHRAPAWNVGSTHYTYANAFRVNDRIFVPIYGPGNSNYLDEDAAAQAAWAAAAGPSVEIVPIDCYDIIPAAGAIHCIVMQVPRYTSAAPSVHVTSPAGGEVAAWRRPFEITWSSSDDVGVDSVDLEYSTDGGATYPHVIATGLPDSGSHSWEAPAHLATSLARVRATAHDAASNSASATSSASFQLAKAKRVVHDFSTGAGVDKWAWGYQTSSWSQVAGNRHPAALANSIATLRPGAYADIAASDATGPDGDPLRYVSLTPTSGSESTHLFEFRLDEPVEALLDIELVYEGYGDDCLQIELYLWDEVAQDWCDARGAFGANAYAANWAGNVDGRLSAHVREGFERYVDANGVLAMLVYAERSTQETFCDYVAVVTTSMPARQRQ